jgi:hypothetical protein
MRITENKLRSIIRSVINESRKDIYQPFPQYPRDVLDDMEDDDDLDIIDADNIPQLDHRANKRKMKDFMSQNRKARDHRDQFGEDSYHVKGAVHSDQLDMMDDFDLGNEEFESDPTFNKVFGEEISRLGFYKDLVRKIQFHCSVPLRNKFGSHPLKSSLELVKQQGIDCVSLGDDRNSIKLSDRSPLSADEKSRLESRIKSKAENHFRLHGDKKLGKLAQQIYLMIVGSYSRSI